MDGAEEQNFVLKIYYFFGGVKFVDDLKFLT